MKNSLYFATATALIFATGNAFAADAVIYDPVPAAPEVVAGYDWTGPYVGVFGGLATGDFEYGIGPSGGPTFIEAEISASGFLGGVQAGYDWQFNNWVFGAVADIAATNYEASVSVDLGGSAVEAESQLKYLGTVRARIGHAWDRTLLYAHGGFAYGKTEQDIAILGFNEEQTRTGWTVGAGLEYALTDRLSFGTEYAYVDLGSEEVFDDGDTFVDEDVAFHTLKAVLNFRF